MSDFATNLCALGLALKRLREQRGLRQEDVAERAGLTRLMVIHVEAGRPTLGAASYAKLAAALGAQLQLLPTQRPTLDEIGALLGDEE
jgi:transcriptional regulator with XRE-family HTH domain